jgi:hypothetical protein
MTPDFLEEGLVGCRYCYLMRPGAPGLEPKATSLTRNGLP